MFNPIDHARTLSELNPGQTFCATDSGVFLRREDKDYAIVMKGLTGDWYRMTPPGHDGHSQFETFAFPVADHEGASVFCKTA